jgi:hypothetical protein
MPTRKKMRKANSAIKNERVPKYFKELAQTWERNTAALRYRENSKARKGLRGREFVYELISLSQQWEDPRFSACLDALVEYGIVDGEFRFTGREAPNTESLKQSLRAIRRNKDYYSVELVRLHTRRDGMSELRACAEVAALGRPAANFGAAVGQLRALMRKKPHDFSPYNPFHNPFLGAVGPYPFLGAAALEPPNNNARGKRRIA